MKSQTIKSPEHIQKHSIDDYENKFARIIIEDRNCDPNLFKKKRLQYYSSIDENILESVDGIDFPTTVNIELINKCNYKCEMCYTVNHSGPSNSLELEQIFNIIDECEKNNLLSLFIGNGSEPTIYKNLIPLVEYACKKIPDVVLFTNGSHLNKKLSEKLIDIGISRINISLDAYNSKTYRKIRKKNNLHEVEQNIYDLVSLKNYYGRPLVRVSFCKQLDNFEETSKFIAKWDQIVDSVEIQDLHIYKNLHTLQKLTHLNSDNLINNQKFCYSPFSYIAIWSNGDISPCCTFHGQKLILGNINHSSIKSAWQGEYIKNLKNQFRNKKLNSICNDCLCETKCL